MTRPYTFHSYRYCKTCNCYARKYDKHKTHDLWFSKERKQSAIFELMSVLTEALAASPFTHLFLNTSSLIEETTKAPSKLTRKSWKAIIER